VLKLWSEYKIVLLGTALRVTNEQLIRKYWSCNAELNFSGHRIEMMLFIDTQQSVWYPAVQGTMTLALKDWGVMWYAFSWVQA
jgi:hypothetical protein